MSTTGSFFAPALAQNASDVSHVLPNPSASSEALVFPKTPTRIPTLLSFLVFLYVQQIPLVFAPEFVEDSNGPLMAGASMEVTLGSLKGKSVAIKRLNTTRLGPETHKAMMRDLLFELKVATHETIQKHENIAKVLAVSIETDDARPELIRPVLLVEAADRLMPDLQVFFRQQTPESFFEGSIIEREEKILALANIIADIADGLSLLHRHRIIHFDLKPANILIMKKRSANDDTSSCASSSLFSDSNLDEYQHDWAELENVGSSQALQREVPFTSQTEPSHIDPTQYVAKIADFGYSGVDASNDVKLRGLTKHWAAPEARTISGDEASFETGALTDCYSFGLLCVYVGLGGVDILPQNDEKEVEMFKNKDLPHIRAQEAIKERYATVNSDEGDRIAEVLQDIIGKTLRKAPGERTWLLQETRTELLPAAFPTAIAPHLDPIVPFDPYWDDILDVSNKQHVGKHAALRSHGRTVGEIIPMLPEEWGEILVSLLNQSASANATFTTIEKQFIEEVLATEQLDRLNPELRLIRNVHQNHPNLGFILVDRYINGKVEDDHLEESQGSWEDASHPTRPLSEPSHYNPDLPVFRQLNAAADIMKVDIVEQGSEGRDTNILLFDAVLTGNLQKTAELLHNKMKADQLIVDESGILRITPLALLLQGSVPKCQDGILELLLASGASLRHQVLGLPVITFALCNPSLLEICLKYEPELANSQCSAGIPLLSHAMTFLRYQDCCGADGIAYSPVSICLEAITVLLDFGATIDKEALSLHTPLQLCLYVIFERLDNLSYTREADDYLVKAMKVVQLFGNRGAKVPWNMLVTLSKSSSIFVCKRPYVDQDSFYEESTDGRLFARPNYNKAAPTGVGAEADAPRCGVSWKVGRSGIYNVIVRIGFINTSERFNMPSLLVKAFEDTDKHNQRPMRWGSRNQRCSQQPYNNDYNCVSSLSDVCPTEETTYTVVVGTLDLVEWSGVTLELHLNVGVHTSGAYIEYVMIQRDDVPILSPLTETIPKQPGEVVRYVNRMIG